MYGIPANVSDDWNAVPTLDGIGFGSKGDSCNAKSKIPSVDDDDEARKRCGPLGPSTDLATSTRRSRWLLRLERGVGTSSYVDMVV